MLDQVLEGGVLAFDARRDLDVSLVSGAKRFRSVAVSRARIAMISARGERSPCDAVSGMFASTRGEKVKYQCHIKKASTSTLFEEDHLFEQHLDGW